VTTPAPAPDPAPDPAIVARLRAAGCVFAEDEARLIAEAASTPQELEDLVAKRVSGLPLEPLIGWAEFCGLRIRVAPGVFVPRHRTEFLVQQAVALAAPDAVVLDLCCGAGAIGAAIASRAGAGVELVACDVEPAAVRCARENIEPAGSVYEGDLYDALPASLRGRVDVLAVNAPYVPTDAIALMPPEARLHEPAVALDGGGDGLDVPRRRRRRRVAGAGRLAADRDQRRASDADGSAVPAGGSARSDRDLRRIRHHGRDRYGVTERR
jgi:release factor glutamine methyltransferase